MKTTFFVLGFLSGAAIASVSPFSLAEKKYMEKAFREEAAYEDGTSSFNLTKANLVERTLNLTAPRDYDWTKPFRISGQLLTINGSIVTIEPVTVKAKAYSFKNR
jgi:hypothetical protein